MVLKISYLGKNFLEPTAYEFLNKFLKASIYKGLRVICDFFKYLY
jgi:hypothetical protein